MKDEHNRIRGLQRLEKRVKAGKLTKSNINNKGYNKYLRLQGDVTIEIDYEKFNPGQRLGWTKRLCNKYQANRQASNRKL